ncbi:uncharacterized protein LOC128548841 [Mercenaria mercenaria]|uniref:uncharacterized protein LOC128548841 n=1 Tax=Mercenaria mercenaria TaxID=6596 RepID=UPI00234E8DA2|nr:uncharacterized protein LOC128548841 [Mercenaria mercenaria]
MILFFEIQNEIFRYFENSKHYLLFGDMNARCGSLIDYVEVDQFISDMYDLQYLENMESESMTNFNTCNVPLNRNCVDTVVNHYGNQLIDMCKNNDLFIWNGRMGTDCLKPVLTCKNASTVDYFISSSFVFENIVDFNVHEFCNLYSDVHCPLEATLRTKFYNTKNIAPQQTQNIQIARLWDSKKSEQFAENLDIFKISEIEMKLDEIVDCNNMTQNNIDEIVSDIGKLFNDCSKQSFGVIQNRANTYRNNNRIENNFPWFDRSCHNARNIYHKTRKTYNKYKTQYFKDMLKSVSKQYKCALRKAKNDYNANRIHKLRNLKYADPKQYWNIINGKSTQNEKTAKLNDFYEYFKDLNENLIDTENSSDENMSETANVNNNEEINVPITEKEILDAVKTLKNNKSPGCDEIINEHIKYTVHSMIHVYKKLFNLVFDHGIIPESWTIGHIKPIYKNKGSPESPENYRPISLLSCFGKLFTCILNNRLTKYADKNNLIHETQAGFRKSYSTVDNIFILKSLIDIVQANKKKLFCCFVDFKQAFDSVWRVGLWQKLIKKI